MSSSTFQLDTDGIQDLMGTWHGSKIFYHIYNVYITFDMYGYSSIIISDRDLIGYEIYIYILVYLIWL